MTHAQHCVHFYGSLPKKKHISTHVRLAKTYFPLVPCKSKMAFSSCTSKFDSQGVVTSNRHAKLNPICPIISWTYWREGKWWRTTSQQPSTLPSTTCRPIVTCIANPVGIRWCQISELIRYLITSMHHIRDDQTFHDCTSQIIKSCSLRHPNLDAAFRFWRACGLRPVPAIFHYFPLLNRYSKPHYGHGGPSLAYLGYQKVEKQSEKGRWFKEGPCKWHSHGKQSRTHHLPCRKTSHQGQHPKGGFWTAPAEQNPAD